MSIKRKAFTMIELIFVIVVLGILAAIAVPKLAATRDDAHIVKGRSDILAIRSGIINERQARMFRGDTSYAATLNGATGLFGNVMAQPIAAKSTNGGWRQGASATEFIFRVMNTDVTFDYNVTNGTFDCAGGAGTKCALLTD